MEGLQQRFGTRVTPRLIDGGRGIFDVKVDGDLVFSKHSQHRFPDPGEVEDLVGTRLGPG